MGSNTDESRRDRDPAGAESEYISHSDIPGEVPPHHQSQSPLHDQHIDSSHRASDEDVQHTCEVASSRRREMEQDEEGGLAEHGHREGHKEAEPKAIAYGFGQVVEHPPAHWKLLHDGHIDVKDDIPQNAKPEILRGVENLEEVDDFDPTCSDLCSEDESYHGGTHQKSHEGLEPELRIQGEADVGECAMVHPPTDAPHCKNGAHRGAKPHAGVLETPSSWDVIQVEWLTFF
mmetsp:Transcript_58381/g.123846  ORF Transcript_58381/g.123846 Transcript_58381/m.123846 type:complete len:232 (-) Transcript_58381:480-1175(-)